MGAFGLRRALEKTMAKLTWSLSSGAACAVALLALSAELANAAPAQVSMNTNLRQGPGTEFGIIATVPAGSVVDVIRCGPEWCNVMAGGNPGYMIARNLGISAPVRVVRVPPPVVVVGPPVYYGHRPYYYGPGFYYGPRRYRRW
jgi:uncharacterized protein YraI